MTAASSGSAALYAERAERYQRLATELGKKSRLVSNLRGLAFGVAAVGLVLATLGHHAPSGPVAALAALVFVGLVAWHARVIAAEDDALRAARVNLDAHARMTDSWHRLSDDGARFVSDVHAYSSDLDLFGPGSVYQRVSVAHTRFGQEALARFFTERAGIAAIRERQEAARELAPRLDERQRLEALALAVVEPPPGHHDAPAKAARKKSEPPDPEPLLKWAEEEPVLSRRRALVVLAHLLPVVTVGLLGLSSLLGWPAALWTVPFAVQLFVMGAARRQAERVFAAVSSTQGAFLRYGPMFELVEGLDASAPLLRELLKGLLGANVRPSIAMRQFERVVGWFELRHNGLIHPFANAFLLWDLHCVLRLEAWQRRAGRGARGWFRALGEVEALSAFAGLAFDEPGFCWPDITQGPARFDAEQLAHPLIARDRRVANDVTLGEPGRALLVTGSNMSGKSTLLRAMGTAAVLALAGAPVAAKRLRLSPLAVRTSLKISDSLARGVSHFYAEVARLKGVVDATAGPEPVFFLLDEILHGTNSEERQSGARWILAELLARGAIGAVSTHDQGLCQLPEPLMSHVVQCHFRESVQAGETATMTFDYLLRPGPVSGGNALRLMRLVGLQVPLE